MSISAGYRKERLICMHCSIKQRLYFIDEEKREYLSFRFILCNPKLDYYGLYSSDISIMMCLSIESYCSIEKNLNKVTR